MPVNPYFNQFGFSSEQNLIEDLVVEAIKMYGIDCYYLPRTDGTVDDLLNEDDQPVYNSYHTIECYIRNIDSFDGEGDILSKFGLQIRDSMTLSISFRSYNEIIQTPTGRSRPFEGDLIYFPLNQKIFKVMHVEHESAFYQFGSLQFYDLRVELYEYSQERFTTGLPELDDKFDGDDYTTPEFRADPDTYDPLADNITIETEADAILDFDPKDPFSPSGW